MRKLNLMIPLIFALLVFLIGCGKEDPGKITAWAYQSDYIKEIKYNEGTGNVEEIQNNTLTEDILTVRLCHDTDNGIVRWTQGTVFGYYDNASRFEFEDYCQNFNYLIEFYCINETPKQQIFLCRNGCVDSHCS